MVLRHILVVEDSDEDFATVQDAARQCSLPNPLVRATSGSECMRLLHLARLSRLGQEGHSRRDALPVLILLDLNTPGDDGREVLSQVRGDELLGTLPLVVLSAAANPRDLQFCYANGANAYHVKPVAYTLHLKMLHSIFDYWLGSVVLPA
jgi:CheY-like chemotaxis protein